MLKSFLIIINCIDTVCCVLLKKNFYVMITLRKYFNIHKKMFMVICYIFPKWPSKFLTILYIKTGINLEIFCCKNIIIESFPFYFSNNYCENWKYLEFNLFICKTSWTVLKSTVSFYYNFLLYSYNGSLKTETRVLSGVHSEQERINTSFGNYVSIIQVIGANF